MWGQGVAPQFRRRTTGTSRPAPDEVQPHELEDILRGIEPSYGYRRLVGTSATFVTLLAGIMALFHLYTARFGLLETVRQRSLHLAFVVAIVFLLYPFRRGDSNQTRFGLRDLLLAGAGVVAVLYVFINGAGPAASAERLTQTELILGVIGLVLVLEAGRRVVGVLPYIAAVMLIYAFAGHLLPGTLAAPEMSLDRMIKHLFFSTQGVFGIPIGVSASFVFMFVLLGAFFEFTGLGQLFVDLAMALGGSRAGGPAKVSVLSSAFLGTVSGSSVTNVVADGVVNIPMMRRLGYSPQFAAGVEAATSVGGHLVPPVMGAAAFVMAEFLNVPYLTIIKAAVLPAIFYFVAVGLMIHFEAKRLNLPGLPREQLPSVARVLIARGYLLLPLACVIGFLLMGYAPLTAAFWGIVLAAGVHIITVFKDGIAGKQSLRGILERYMGDIWDALVYGSRSGVAVAVAIAVVGLIVGLITLTGFGGKFASLTEALGQQNLFLLLVFVAGACTIIGSGIPTTATYIILAVLAAPALVQLGVPPIVAHFFIFYFGVLADLTPPIAVAAYAAAGIARSDPFRSGFTATRLALAGIIVPFVFVYSPALLLEGKLGDILLTCVTAFLGIVALAAGASGYLAAQATKFQRILLIAAAVALIFDSPLHDAVGVGLMAFVWLLHRFAARRASVVPAAPE